MKRLLLLTLSLFFLVSIKAQDIHFTQVGFAPLSINPAQTGLFSGTFRINGLYRSQWNSGVKNGYQTPILGIDVNLKGFAKTHWIGIGVNIDQDKAGLAALKNNLAALNLGYHIGLDSKMTQVFSLGVQGGFVQRSLNTDGLRFQDAIQSGGSSLDLPLITANAKNYIDFSVGINYKAPIGKKLADKSGYNIGLSIEHVTGPKLNVFEPNTGKVGSLPRRINLYANVDYGLTKSIRLYPAVIVRTAAGLTETMLQGVGGLVLNQKDNTIVRAGIGYRVGDALQALVGIDYGDIRAGLAYDITTSTLRSSTSVKDGFELGVTYIGKIFKKPTSTPVILCPKY